MLATIRSRLLLLALSVLLPAALGVGWMVGRTLQAEREAHARTLREMARAMALVVDRELLRRQAMLHVLAQSTWLDDTPDEHELAKFRTQAERALDGVDGWIELRAPGRVLLDTRQGAGALPRPGPATLATRPEVRPLQVDADGMEEPYAAVVEPVPRGERVLYELVVAVRPSEMQALVDGIGLPPGWVGAVVDARGVFIARHPGGATVTGRGVTPDMRQRIVTEREGLYEATSIDGVPMVGYFSRSSGGWVFSTAMPREQFAGLLPDAVRRIVLGALALLVLAIVGARFVARGIVGSVQALKTAAARMQAGEPVPVQTTGIAECDEVALVLAESAEAIRHNRSDLERQVADAVERTRLAEQRISQSQRVEALGRLTGGVAHDFNNLLGVISNSAHLIQRHPAAAELQVPVSATLRAVEVGSQLTQHLLRFAGRQPLRPQLVHLGRYLPELQELMRSVLGRRVEVVVKVAPDTEPVRVDGGEFELALVNLALNARDAMPSGGELRISASNASAEDLDGVAGLKAGRYVLIAVGDDGVGLAPEAADHAFEPFYTTKAVGRGTGLGLSQVHGFAAQSGGAARLASTPGVGTTVSLLLPAGGAEDAAAEGPAAAPAPLADVAGLAVLLVEDNESLGDVTAALLRSHGVEVRRAAGAEEALAQIDAGAPVDAVLSDVVMPGRLDGLGLARELRRRRPQLPVLLITGFSKAASAAAVEFTVLKKPCPEAELLRALAAARPTPA